MEKETWDEVIFQAIESANEKYGDVEDDDAYNHRIWMIKFLKSHFESPVRIKLNVKS